jgi:hypothetical protein
MQSATVEQEQVARRTRLDASNRRRIASAAVEAIKRKIWDPKFNGTRWSKIVESHWDQIVDASDTLQFESSLHSLIQVAAELTAVPSSDIGFFHESSRRKTAPKGLAARFRYCEPNECSPGNTAALEGADVLYSRLENRVGWLKVTRFPGAIGIDTANEIDQAIRELKKMTCDRLILDLRGNASGGLAFLRLMGYLTPGKLVGGYSITRVGAEKGTPKESLKQFDWVPNQKWAVPWLLLKYGLADPSVKIVTEGLGLQPFHGRTVVLINRDTTGAGERVAAFAAENGLAKLIGSRTAGKLICSDSVKVGPGYFVRVPARIWLTGKGKMLENVGVYPDVEIEFNPNGRDNQLRTAKELLN